MSRALAIFIALFFFWATTHLPIDLSHAEDQKPDEDFVFDIPQPVHTTSRFETKLETQTQTIARNTVTKDDPEREIGDDATVQEGKDGKKTTIWKVTYFEGTEYEREKVSTDIENPEDKIIAKGTKIVWRTLATQDGEVRYWRKIRVWATHYDSHCPGCNEW